MRWLLPAGPAVLLGALVAACTVGRPAVAPPPAPVRFDSTAYQGFVVPAPLLPFRLQGAVQFSYRGEREVGDVSLQALPGPVYGLQMHARLTGGLALEVRFDRARVMVVDYVNESYVLAANTPDTRLRLFDMDLAPHELQTLLTGRVSRDRFAAGGGNVAPDGSGAAFREDGAWHRFRLGPDGLPREWVKEDGGAPVFRAEFREYLDVPQPGGPPLRLPRKVRLYGGGGAPGNPDGGGPALLALGVRDFQPGVGSAAPLALDALPAGARDFAPGRLPERPAQR